MEKKIFWDAKIKYFDFFCLSYRDGRFVGQLNHSAFGITGCITQTY